MNGRRYPAKTPGAERIVGVRLPGESKPNPYGRINLAPDTASVVRQLARHEKITLDALVQRMLRVYVKSVKGAQIVSERDVGSAGH